jgi:hypothetical protein
MTAVSICLMLNQQYTDQLLRILISAKAAGKARADPGCACFVPEPGQNIHLPLSKKKQASLENGWAFLSMFGSGPLWI